MRGELIGINTAILSRSGGYQGIGFAIPTNMARPIMDELVKNGHVSRGYLGIGIATLNQDLARQKRLTVTRGVLVAGVTRGTPAAQAGLRTDDVITAVDGQPIKDSGHLRNMIAMKGAGARVVLDVVRGRHDRKVDVTLARLPDPRQQLQQLQQQQQQQRQRQLRPRWHR